MINEKIKEYKKAWYEAHKDLEKVKMKAYYESNKDKIKAYQKAYKQANKDELKDYQKAYNQTHNVESKEYKNSDVNTLGQKKHNIRTKSRYFLKKYGTKIPGYEIHHCFTYDDPTKFIYCSKEIHLKIHQYLRDNTIDADSDHYEQIKHLLDEKVIIFK